MSDAVLQSVDGHKFPVHRCVLAAGSGYLKTMFLGDFREARSNVKEPIVLKNVGSPCLSSLLGYIYTGKLNLTNKIVHEVLAGAHMMQLHDVIDTRVNHLIKRISTVTCFQTMSTAEKYDLSQVHKAVKNLILRKFSSLSKVPEFKEMPVAELCKYLVDDRLQGENRNFHDCEDMASI